MGQNPANVTVAECHAAALVSFDSKVGKKIV